MHPTVRLRLPAHTPNTLYTPHLLVYEAGGDGRTSKLLLAARNSMLPLASLQLGSSATNPGLRELLTELDNFVPGVWGK